MGKTFAFIIRRFLLILGTNLLLAGHVFAVAPVNGWWWNPSESGSGYAIERQGNSIFMAAFLYETNGAATWYATVLALQPDGTYKGDMTRYVGGKSLLGSYKAPASTTVVASATATFPFPNRGNLTIGFANGTPNRTIPIYRFGFSNPVFEPSRASSQNGWWWNDQESGTGYFVEVQGNRAFIAKFMYDPAGQPTWYASSSTLSGNNVLSGPLDMYSNGQSLNGSYKTPSVIAGGAGNTKFEFNNDTIGIMTLPNTVRVPIKRFVFDPQVFSNREPVPNAGASKNVTVGDTVYLSGTGTDADNDPLTFSWNFLTAPSASKTLLYNWRTNSPNFIADVAGEYRFALIVDDGKVSNANSVVTVTANPKVVTNIPPVAYAGANQTVTVGSTVRLSGSGRDSNGDALSFTWAWVTKPPTSSAFLVGSATASPSFIADVAGSYMIGLTVNDGKADSPQSTLTVSAIAAPAGGGVNAASGCEYSNTSTGNDPLLAYQWHIKNNDQYFATNNPANGAGLDLCMGSLWASGITGVGVKVNVVDTGLEIAHPDLASRIIPRGSYNFLNASTDPTNTDKEGDHGTSVSGLIASSKENGVGGSGIAPEANLQGYNFLSATPSYTTYSISFGSNNAYSAANADIFNYSAGSSSSSLLTPFSPIDTILTNKINLRSSKGAIFIKSAGNGFNALEDSDEGNPTYCRKSGVTCQNVNQDATNTIYNTMVVAALNADGTKSSYSTTGSAIWLSGFGGEYGGDASVIGNKYPSKVYKPGMLTTDQSGCIAGYVKSGISANLLDKGNGTGVQNGNCDYTATFNGTSSAAPTVSGVVALMLQANPALTWRDVRHILATTARRVNPSQAHISDSFYFGSPFVLEQGWVLNSGGYWYHNWYGFGLVNAAAAVAMAKNYVSGNLGAFLLEKKTALLGPSNIPYASTGVTTTFKMRGEAPSTVEQAELLLYFGTSFVPMCIQIELTSPRGTKSIILNAVSAHTSASTSGVRFLSNAFYGEPVTGDWTLRFINVCSSPVQTLSSTNAQQLTIRGR